MPETDVDRSETMQRLRAQRDRLRDCLLALETVLNDDDSQLIGDDTAAKLVALAQAFDAHVTFAEGPDGLYQDLLDDSFEVASEIDHLRREHGLISQALATADARIQGADTRGARSAIQNVVKLLTQHRQHGADLLYHAYNVDVAAGD